MPRYRITDPATGETLTVSGERAPTQAEAEDIFASRSKPEQPSGKTARDPAYAKEHAPWPFGSGSEGMAMARTVALPLAAFPLAAAAGGPGAGAALLRTGARVVSGAAAASEGASAVQKAKRGDFIGAGKDALLAYVFSRGMKGGVPAALPAEAEAAALPAAARRAMTEAEKQALMPGTVAGGPAGATAAENFSKLVGGIAPGETKVVNGIRYVWGPKGGWFEPAAEKAARLAAEAAPAAKAASGAPAAAAAGPPLHPSVALSRAIEVASKDPSPATAGVVKEAFKAAVETWKAQGYSKEKIVQILQRKDFGQTAARARKAVDEVF